MLRRPNLDGTVSSYKTKDGETRYRIAYWVTRADGDTARRFKRGFKSEKQAVDALVEVQVDIRRGDHIEETRQTLNGYAEKYFDSQGASDDARRLSQALPRPCAAVVGGPFADL